MQLKVDETSSSSVRAGYSCPCGCTPAVDFRRGGHLVEEACCCGNHFAVGPQAGASLSPRPGFQYELQTFATPWGERIEAAWLVGPSTHGNSRGEPGHDREMDHHGDAAVTLGEAIDPVCGMTVLPDRARANALHTAYRDADYYFCGRGCKLDFDETPERYMAPGYSPSM